MTTIVSCLYDLAGREQSRRRSIDEYFTRCHSVLDSAHGVVIFCEAALADRVREARADRGPTVVLERPFEELDAYPWRPMVESSLGAGRRSPAATSLLKDTPDFFVLTWSKPAMLSEVATLDPFDSSRCWWVDFGIDYVARQHPTLTFDEVLDAADAPLCVSLLRDVTLADVRDRAAFYETSVVPCVAGGLLGGNRDLLRELDEWFALELQRCLATGWMALEEMVLGPVFAEHRDAFTIVRASHEELLERIVECRVSR